MYNEAAGLNDLFQRLLPVLEALSVSFELICVDDGCTDDTVEMLRQWQAEGAPVTIVRLSRNFGKERALAAGLDRAVGEVVVPLDADLQDPPELIATLLAKWQEGYDMVVARRVSRPGDSQFKVQSARWFYRVMNRFSEIALPENAGDFRLMDRRVVDAIKALPERARFHKGLYAWIGYSTSYVDYERPARLRGVSKWSYWKLWNYALDGIFSFSTAPLRLWSYIGALTAFFGFFYAVYTIIRTLLLGIEVPGYASLLVLTLILNGFLLIGVGVIGEYIGRVFGEVKGRPLYLIDAIEQGPVNSLAAPESLPEKSVRAAAS
ncbi:MAG: glycosyltransferase family 2 protein [Pseudomonadota bacterium]